MEEHRSVERVVRRNFDERRDLLFGLRRAGVTKGVKRHNIIYTDFSDICGRLPIAGFE